MSLEQPNMGAIKDWRKALRAPPAYRIVNKTLRNQTQFISLVAVLGLILLIIVYMFPKKPTSNVSILTNVWYNYTYPLTAPIKTSYMYTFRIGKHFKTVE